MIIVFVLLLTICVLVIQHRLADRNLQSLVYQNEVDRELAEPDQTITLTSTVRNVGRLPVFYVNFMEPLPEEVQPREDEDWRRHHLKRAVFGYYCTSSLYLLAHRRYTRRFRFSLPERGRYQLGRYYLAVGDYFGLNTKYREGKIDRKVVVMPRRCDNPQTALTLGGYLGEISVRRFLFEDPVLTIGVREYTGSEPMKQISWKQTARTGTLQVKNYDYTVDVNVTILLNFDGGSEADLECCYQITRTVCETLEQRRIPYEFYGNGDLYGPSGAVNRLYEGLGNQHFRTLMYALGQCSGVAFYSFPTMVDRCFRNNRRSRGYIVISPPLREKEQEGMRMLRRLSETEPLLLIGAAEKGGEAL